MNNPPVLSIVIVNHNTRDLLLRCLRSIRRHVREVSSEVLVVDNGSSDGSADAVENEFPEVRLFRSGSNLGFAAGNNLALAAARGRYVWLLNSDIELLDGVATKLIQFLDEPSRESVGIVGPNLVRPDGRPDECWGKFPSFRRYVLWLARSMFSVSGGLLRLVWTARPCDPPTEVEYVVGAALMIRQRVIERIGLMDERFFMFCEDVDWCFRARQAGFSAFILPEVCVQHLRGGSLKTWERRAVEECSTESHDKFLRKHWNFPAVCTYLAARRVYRFLWLRGRSESPPGRV